MQEKKVRIKKQQKCSIRLESENVLRGKENFNITIY